MGAEAGMDGEYQADAIERDGQLTVDELRLAIGATTGTLPPRSKVAALVAQFDAGTRCDGERAGAARTRTCSYLASRPHTCFAPTRATRVCARGRR